LILPICSLIAATKAEIKMFGQSLKGADVSLKGSVHLP